MTEGLQQTPIKDSGTLTSEQRHNTELMDRLVSEYSYACGRRVTNSGETVVYLRNSAGLDNLDRFLTGDHEELWEMVKSNPAMDRSAYFFTKDGMYRIDPTDRGRVDTENLDYQDILFHVDYQSVGKERDKCGDVVLDPRTGRGAMVTQFSRGVAQMGERSARVLYGMLGLYNELGKQFEQKGKEVLK